MLPHAPRDRAQEGGAALAVLLHMVLLLAVIGQLVYLASRYRVRVDLTTDKLWSSTASTRGLIEKLDEGLVIQAFFSPKEKLPVTYRTTRAWADNFLDELVQLGKGKVVLQRLDPNADKDTADMAKRVGIKPLELKSSSST
ncbi:MAG: Gldg family protein, partial [Planctomycetes bacterium]|nr:Gldg family protein [Planctomycetota bacterium]